MEKKVHQGSLLLNNILHGIMSNVENSLYLWDLSKCLNKPTKNILINWTINVMLNNEIANQNNNQTQSKKISIYKELPVLLINTRDLVNDLRLFNGQKIDN